MILSGLFLLNYVFHCEKLLHIITPILCLSGDFYSNINRKVTVLYVYAFSSTILFPFLNSHWPYAVYYIIQKHDVSRKEINALNTQQNTSMTIDNVMLCTGAVSYHF
jgi:hypothetical protein